MPGDETDCDTIRSEKQLSVLKKSRAGQRGAATKLVSKITDLLYAAQGSDNPTPTQQLRGCYERLVEKCAQLTQLDQQVLALLTDKDEISDEKLACEELMNDLQDKLAETKYVVANPISCKASTAVARVKLPKLDLPQFDGKYTEWTSFWDQFNASVHAEHSLSDSQKLNYLKRSLRGEAAKVISEFSITDGNYKAARELLCARFENKRCILRARFQALYSYPSLKSENPSALRKFQTAMMEHIQALQNLGVTDEHLLVFLIAEKLDPETRKQWELHESKDVSISDPQQVTDLLVFLETRVRALEATPFKTTSEGSKTQTKPQSTNQSYLGAQAQPCAVCKAPGHPIYKCSAFNEMTGDQRMAKARELGLCFNCLSSGHRPKSCPSSRTCRTCSGKHHSLLHKDEQPLERSGHVNNSSSHLSIQGVLSTIQIMARDRSNKWVNLRALLDSGSTVNVMTTQAAQRLGLPQKRTAVTYTGIARTNMPRPSAAVTLDLYCPYKEQQLTTTALVLKTITYDLPSQPIDTSGLTQLDGLQLADPMFHTPGPIDLLIGIDLYESILLSNKFQLQPKLHARETLCGWVLSGTLNSKLASTAHSSTTSPVSGSEQVLHIALNSISSDVSSVDQLLTRFWEIENVPGAVSKQFTPEEQQCEDFFAQTTSRTADGRYEVDLPFNSDAPPIGESFNQAKRRFLALEKRLQSTGHKAAYTDYINGYKDAGHMERVPTDELDKPNHQVFYLPHHNVMKDSSTHKLRVVFDGSAKSSSGWSLNASLLTGPTLQDNLTDILLRFRFHSIALCADVEKMYRQVGLKPSSRDYHRLLWRDQPSQPIEVWRMTRVTFGIRSSAHHAVKALRSVADDQHHPLASPVILRDFVVDDMISGTSTVEEAVQLQEALQQTLESAGFCLRKWSSNVPAAIQHLPADIQEAPKAYEFNDDTYQMKVLGVRWLPLQDVFTFTVTDDVDLNSIKTKRQMFSDIAKLYDPLGWLSPLVILFKILVQRTWIAGVDWDDCVPGAILETWLSARRDLPVISRVSIPRCVFTSNTPTPSRPTVELHAFCDASETAYSAVIYTRVRFADDSYFVSLLTAKSRVAPVKTLSLPRLELSGAVLAAKLVQSTTLALSQLDVNISRVIAWTDSTIVLSWLASYPGTWGCFVANRVSLIQEQVSPSHWKHVPSEQNPADCASRGKTATELLDFSLWWNGPNWLTRNESQWPQQPSIPTATALERRKRTIGAFHMQDKRHPPVIEVERFSNLDRLQRALAYVLRFIDQFCGLELKKGPIQQSELVMTQLKLLALHQKQYFDPDVDLLQAPTRRYSGRLLALSPFYDEETSLIRVGGRLAQGSHSPEMTHPAVVDGKSHLAVLLIRKAHRNLLHAGPQATLYELRRQFWILDGPRSVQRVIRQCTTCRRFMAKAEVPRMSDLPTERVTPSRPFTRTGLDFAGPVTVKSSMSKATQKAYIFLFVCFSTKAIHIELVSALTTSACIAGLKRFVSRRGLPSTIYSDNGTNFIGARNELTALQDLLSTGSDSSLTSYAASRGVEWVTIPPRAPHFGGLWEAAVKSCKTLLRRAIGQQVLTYEELYTVLTMVEASLNSRPMSPMSSDANDLAVLTPGHFLIGSSLQSLPSSKSTQKRPAEPTLQTRWQLVQSINDSFWDRWCKEYLSNLQQRTKWKKDSEPLKVCDLVLIKEDRTPPLQWSRGRILDLYPGNDGVPRVARLKTPSGIYNRPVTKLIRLLPNDENMPKSDK